MHAYPIPTFSGAVYYIENPSSTLQPHSGELVSRDIITGRCERETDSSNVVNCYVFAHNLTAKHSGYYTATFDNSEGSFDYTFNVEVAAAGWYTYFFFLFITLIVWIFFPICR